MNCLNNSPALSWGASASGNASCPADESEHLPVEKLPPVADYIMQPLPGSLAYRKETFLLLRTFCIKRLRSENLHVQYVLLHAYTSELLQHFFLMLSWGMYKQEKYSLDKLKESPASEHILWRISYCIRAQISYMKSSPGSLTYKWPSVWMVIDLHQRSQRYSHQKRSTTCIYHVYTCTCMHTCVYDLLYQWSQKVSIRGSPASKISIRNYKRICSH